MSNGSHQLARAHDGINLTIAKEDSDDGEPKLEIVDEDSIASAPGSGSRNLDEVSEETGPSDYSRSTSGSTDGSTSVRIFRKSFSVDEQGQALLLKKATRDIQKNGYQHQMSLAEEESNATEAIESLLMLGRGPILSPESSREMFEMEARPGYNRRHSISNDIPSQQHLARLATDRGLTDASYYQKMRERNNEASKRCRLKRRMKAESMENQANLLNMTNRMLKQRISKMESICAIVQEGVRKIQGKNGCTCTDTILRIKKFSCENQDCSLSNKDQIEMSIKYRSQKLDGWECSGSSMDEEVVRLDCPSSLPCSPSQLSPLPTKSLNVSPSLSLASSAQLLVRPLVKIAPKKQQNGSKTALDVINDTIVRSLATPSPTSTPPISGMPLNLVKIPARSSTTTTTPSARNSVAHDDEEEEPPRKIVLVSSIKPNPSLQEVVAIKCEPEVQIIEGEEAQGADDVGVDPITNCIAAAHGTGLCEGEKLNLNKLTSFLDLITRQVTVDSGSSAMERAILKSRLRIPFWKVDDTTTFICERHRHDILFSPSMTTCALCSRKRAKKPSPTQATMMTITYRMSLENYTTTGNILPIGLVVCGNCKEKQLKGVDFSNSQVVDFPEGQATTKSAAVSITAIPNPTTPTAISRKTKPVNDLASNSVTISKTVSGDDIRALVAPVQRQQAQHSSVQVVPTTYDELGGNDTIFTKIGRLNEALRAINPRYKPIGFSITNIESCSNSVLKDAVKASETAITTLLSVIAPGNEAFLWESVKPKLDGKLEAEDKSIKQTQSRISWTGAESSNASHPENEGHDMRENDTFSA